MELFSRRRWRLYRARWWAVVFITKPKILYSICMVIHVWLLDQSGCSTFLLKNYVVRLLSKILAFLGHIVPWDFFNLHSALNSTGWSKFKISIINFLIQRWTSTRQSVPGKIHITLNLNWAQVALTRYGDDFSESIFSLHLTSEVISHHPT